MIQLCSIYMNFIIELSQKQLQAILMLRTHLIKRLFSDISTVRHPATKLIDGQQVVLDTYDSLRHNSLITSFLDKRSVKRSEVAPKIFTLHQPIQQISNDLQQQTEGLVIKQKPIHTSSKQLKEVTSQTILQRFNQPFLIQLINAYVSKVLVNGKIPPFSKLSAYEKIKNEVIRLYRIFFFGQPLTVLEQTIQNIYLSIKKDKYLKITHASFQCHWTQQDSRGINKWSNWQHRPSEIYQNERPFFIPHEVAPKLSAQETINDVMMLIFPFNLKWNLLTKYNFIPGSKRYFDTINHQIMARIVNYLHSQQFLKFINIPEDFEIYMAMIDCHVWMIIDKYKKVGTPKYKYLASKLEASVKGYANSQVGHLAIKKADKFAKTIKSNTDSHFKSFTYHFNMGGFSRNNYYKGIDALVWSHVFLQKVGRYSDLVYKFSEYLIKNYEKIQKESLQTLDKCMFEFDIHLQEPGYKQRIQQMNPKMSEQQFQKQFSEDKDVKTYYYNYLVNQEKDVIHLSKVYPTEDRLKSDKQRQRQLKQQQENNNKFQKLSGWKKSLDQILGLKKDVVKKFKTPKGY